MQHPARLKDPQGFVRISFVCSDGLQGETLIDSADAEKTFHALRKAAMPLGSICHPGQLTLNLSLADEQAAAHTFK